MSIAKPELIEQYKQGDSVLAPKANPIHSGPLNFEDVEELRWLGCPHYSSCLAHAALSGWTSFICIKCELAVRNTNVQEGNDAKQSR